MKRTILISVILSIVIGLAILACGTTEPEEEITLRITSLTISLDSLGRGDTAIVKANIEYTGDYNLTYTWRATGGTIVGSGDSILWIAPEFSNCYMITLIINAPDVGGYQASVKVGVDIFKLVKVGHYDLTQSISYYNGDFFITDEYAYIVDGYDFRIISISNPNNLQEIGFYDTPGYSYDVFISGQYAYIADGSVGLQIIDITDPTSLHCVGHCDIPLRADRIYVSGEYAYILSSYNGVLWVIDISDRSDPHEVGHVYTPDRAIDVYVFDSGDYAYIAGGDAGLRIIDVSDRGNPHEVGYFITPGYAQGVFISNEYAYVADGNAGLLILNVSNPSKPIETGFIYSVEADEVYVSGDYAFVVEHYSDNVVRAIDISIPSSPLVVAFYDFDYLSTSKICAYHGHLYVLEGKTLHVLDISRFNDRR